MYFRVAFLCLFKRSIVDIVLVVYAVWVPLKTLRIVVDGDYPDPITMLRQTSERNFRSAFFHHVIILRLYTFAYLLFVDCFISLFGLLLRYLVCYAGVV